MSTEPGIFSATRRSVEDQCVIDPDTVALDAGGPRLVWAAPGSQAVDQVLAGYRAGGLAGLARVSGPWGVVLWDPQRRSHVIATDPIGVQPMFWARTSGGAIAVSSRIAVLADRPDVSEDLDHEGILISEARACTGEAGLEHTRFLAIRSIGMGRAIEVGSQGRITRHRYYDPRQIEVDESLSLEDCSDLLVERIDAAVRRSVQGEHRFGSHVSGGLDCTTIACRASQVLGERGQALVAGYSWAPSEEEIARFPGDERDLLDAVTAQEGFPIRRVSRGPHGRWFFERDPNRYPQSTHNRERFILPVAQQDGIDVMLSGWGGDELSSFNGRVVADHLFRTGQWGQLLRIGASNVRRKPGRARRVRGAARLLAGTAFWQLPEQITSWRHPGDRKAEAELDREIDDALRSVSELAADLRRERYRRFQRMTDPHDYQLELLTGGHLQHRTGGWYQTGELFGIRYRYPLLDLGVVEAALSLPWYAYRSRGWTRIAYRRAASTWVPAEVAWNLHKVEPALFFPPTAAAGTANADAGDRAAASRQTEAGEPSGRSTGADSRPAAPGEPLAAADPSAAGVSAGQVRPENRASETGPGGSAELADRGGTAGAGEQRTEDAPAGAAEQAALVRFEVPDPRYRETMRVVGLSYRRATQRGRVDPDSRVQARPDAAV